MRARTSALMLCAAAVLTLCGCNRGQAEAYRDAAALTGGDPHKGKALIGYYGCGSCHTIQGLANATGEVGPPLTGIARRTYIAGVLENNTENIVRWIENPRAVDEKTAMPYLGVKDSDARDIAAFLYTLR